MKIYIVGQDERSVKLRELYEKEKVKLEEADVVVCPIPFSKDMVNINNSDMTIEDMILKLKNSNKTLVSGAIKDSVINKLKENNINVIDLLDYEQYSIKNAVATSEGAIKKAIEMTDFTLNKSNVLILGYGRIGKALARNLEGFGANIFCEARKKKDIALIESMGYNGVDLKDLDLVLPKMDIVFNTIPTMILDKNKVALLNRKACVIDLASAPGGVDFEELYKNKINTAWYLAVPSKDSPYSAALYIKETIDELLGEEDKWEKRLT